MTVMRATTGSGVRPIKRAWGICCGVAKRLLETATRGAVVFPRQVKALLQEVAGASRSTRRQRDSPSPAAKAAKADDLAAAADQAGAAGQNQCGQRAFGGGISNGTTINGSRSCGTRESTRPTIGPSRRFVRRWSTAKCGAATARKPGGGAVDSDDGIVHGQTRTGRDAMEFVSRVLRSPHGSSAHAVAGYGVGR